MLHPRVDVPYSLVVYIIRNLSLDGELFLRDGKNAAFVQVYHLSSLQTSLENVKLCVRTCAHSMQLWVHYRRINQQDTQVLLQTT